MLTPVEARIAAILGKTGRINAGLLARETSLSGLQIDSVRMLEAIFAIEEAFDITIPLDAAVMDLTLGGLAEMVDALVRARP